VSASPTDRFRRVDTIFDAAVDVPATELTAFIDRECAGDEDLRAEVLELVRAYHRSDSFLESPASRLAAPLLEAAAAIGGPVPDHIGPFRVVREIGRGGMGRVFLGERADGQFEQRVAIKLIQHGAPGVLRRFVEERRILARLEHPGIARLVDGGITESGLPYFAMELVEGEPIDRYCDTHALTLDQRIELFTSVCDAVAYAHQHLVIHRDLKPSNILVGADGKIKLLDFGIAKLLGAQHDGEDVTQTHFSVMTPEFAAPEQIRNAPISTATDVYSLGVLLHLLLTGERPYDVRGKSPAEIERIVCDEVPPKPSTRLAAAWRRQLRGDLDLIVMTALQKLPERRYQSPAALAQDLQRFRQGHAILARPDSAPYRLRKFVGRHRAGVALAALLVVALAAAIARERMLRRAAEVQARRAAEVEDFLVGVFDVADPNAWKETEGGRVTARELLDRGASRIDSTLTGQPEVQAELRNVLGRVYTNLGLYDRAMPLLRASLAQRTALRGPADTSVAETMDMLGVALTELNEHDEAEPLLRRALEQRRRVLGNAHPATARSAEHLATLLEARNQFAPAETLYREAVAIHRAVADSSVEVADALGSLGVLLGRRARHAEAESLHRSALAINVRRVGEKHPSTTASMQNLAAVLAQRGRATEAESLHRRALAAKRLVLGDTHPSVTISMNNLANLLTRQMDRFAEGESLARRALVLDRAMYGDRHTFVAEGLANLGIILRILGRTAEADSVLREALAINRSVFGERHGRVASNLSALAQVRAGMLDGAGAIAYMRQSSGMYRELLGDSHLSTITTTISLGFLLAEFGDPVEGESILRGELRRLDPGKGEHNAQLMSAELGLGKALIAQRRSADAVPLLASAVERLRGRFGEGNWRTADGLITYGEALAAERRYAEAGRALRDGRAAMSKGPRIPARMAARAAAAMARLPAGVEGQGAR
jgi:tetratricopeptide (TPR) repeat protein